MATSVGRIHAIARLVVSARRAFQPLCVWLALGLGLVPMARAAEPQAHGERLSATGVRNLGRLTPMLYRSGDFVPDGVQSIVDLGIKTVISVRWNPHRGERDSCRVHGIAFHAFQMSPKRAPDPATVDSILAIVKNAKAPVLIHCTAGDHRTGTICALYRIRVQGWAQKAAWAEQEYFGFGPPERHPELFKFVYGDGAGLK